MYDIISTAKNTQWSSFPNLSAKYSYSHVANEAVDFQVIPGKNCFAGFNRKFGFELLRTSSKEDKDVIQRLKKRQVDDLSCGAISKTSGAEIAIGKTTGFIRLFNVQSGDWVPVKFKPDRVGNSVVGLDYSNTDEYLAAVFDNNDINLYGLKTGVKTDTFRFDGQSTFVRFHPAKKFALAVGSFEGAITMQDIQTKKKLFFDKNAHTAPVKDIAMWNSSQDLFVSCGYDMKLKVFDLRKRAAVQQHVQAHPMSTISVSPCGTFCVAGNLKGDVITFDFRTMKEALDMKRVHDSAVVRVAFVPSVTGAANMTMEQSVCSPSVEVVKSMQTPPPQHSNSRDSFAKFVDICHYNNLAAAEYATPKRNDSWADLMPAKKCHDFSMDSVLETPSRPSNGWDAVRSELRLKRLSRATLNQSVMQTPAARTNDVENKVTEFDGEYKNVPARRTQFAELDKFGDLQKIQEENTEINGSSHMENKKPLGMHDSNVNSLVNSRKRRSTFHDSFSMHIKNTNTSSPTLAGRSEANAPMKADFVNQNYNTAASVNGTAKVVTGNSLRNLLSDMVDQKFDGARYRITSQINSTANAMKTRINQLADEASDDIKESLEHFYMLGLKGGENLFDRLEEQVQPMEIGLAELLKQDPYAHAYFRMKYQIIALKEQLGIREPSILHYLH